MSSSKLSRYKKATVKKIAKRMELSAGMTFLVCYGIAVFTFSIVLVVLCFMTRWLMRNSLESYAPELTSHSCRTRRLSSVDECRTRRLSSVDSGVMVRAALTRLMKTGP